MNELRSDGDDNMGRTFVSTWSMSKAVASTAAVAMAMSAVVLTPALATAQSSTQGSSEYHEVSSGDTLWDLSGWYFGDHYEWPRMWSYNSHITNPHWIYPGDIIYLQQPEVRDEEADPPADETDETLLGHEDSVGLYMALGGMIASEQEEAVGRIIGSPKEARMLAEHDEVWVGFGEEAYTEEEQGDISDDEMAPIEDAQAEVGDRFALIRQDGKVSDGDDTKGLKYYVVGSLTITKVSEQEGVAKTAQIDESWREIERGDLLVPYERQLQLIQPREADQDLVARIVDSLDPGFTFGPQEYVFLNRGAEDGVRPGNRFFVYQQWEGFEHPHEETASEIPWQQVGQVMVLNVREHFSTAVITRSSREVFIGDRLEMYSGH